MDIYQIAVRLNMTSNAPAFLSMLSSKILGVHADVRKLEGGFNRLHVAIMGGIAGTAGAATIAAMKALGDEAKELTKNLAALQNFNIPQAQIANIDKLAKATALSVRGSTEASNLGIATAAYSMFGRAGAMAIMQPLAKFATVQGSLSGNYDDAQHQIYDLLRSGDLMGKLVNDKTRKVDPDRLLSYLDTVAKIEAATHNAIDPATFLQVAKQGGPALGNLSDQGLLTVMMAAQGMGGFRAGTSLMSSFRQFVGGRMTQPMAEELKKFGLVGDFTVGRGGHILFPDSSLNTPFAKALGEDPLKAAQLLTSTLSQHGISGTSAQISELFRMFGQQTEIRLFADLIRNLPQMTAERARIEKSAGINRQYDTDTGKNLATAENDLAKSWQNLMQAVAGPGVNVEIATLNKLADTLNSVSAAVYKMNPKTIQDIGIGVGIFGASLAGAGGVAMLAALGPAGWLVLGTGALAAALATVRPDILKEIGSGITDMFTGIKNLDVLTVVKGFARTFDAEFLKLPGMVQDAIVTAVKNLAVEIGQALIGGLGGVGNWLRQHIDYTGGGYAPGLIRASYGGSFASGISNVSATAATGSYAVLGASGTPSSLASYIAKRAPLFGIDPRTAVAVANSEGLHRYIGDHGTSFGPFQLHRHGGLADLFTTATGLDPRDPRTVAAQINFALAWASKHGWSAFHGAANTGISRWQGIGAPPRTHKETPIHTQVVLDGRVIARAVTRAQTRMALMPHALGPMDVYGTYAPAGMTQMPA